MPITEHLRTCPLCEAMCGLRIDVEDGRVVRIRPNHALLVHPEDSRRLGLADGGRATIRSAAGEVVAPVEVSDEMMPGVVCLPHGWGHDRPGTRVRVARDHAGINNNLLAPGALVDEPSGNAVVNGIPVEVSPA
jgi:anaerobic selenocysteine-containing dehydrogenase